MISFNIHDKFSFTVCGEQNKHIESYLIEELGYFKSEVASPDLEIELVDEIPEGKIFLPFYGRNGDLFYLKDRYGSKISLSYRVFKGKLIAERKIAADFLKNQIIEPLMFYNLLEKGCTFIHASAVSKGNAALIFCGSQDTGKTNIALSLLFHNYSFLSNEWTLISKEGFVYPYPTLIPVVAYNLQAFPNLLNIVSKNYFDKQKIRSKIFISRKRRNMELGHSRNLTLRATDLVLGVISNLIFKINAKDLGAVSNVSRIEKLFILETDSQVSEVDVREVENKKDMVTRLSANLLWERDMFTKHYLAYLFAFPEGRNPVVEDTLKLHGKVISEALKDVPCFQATLPESIPFKEAFERFRNI